MMHEKPNFPGGWSDWAFPMLGPCVDEWGSEYGLLSPAFVIGYELSLLYLNLVLP